MLQLLVALCLAWRGSFLCAVLKLKRRYCVLAGAASEAEGLLSLQTMANGVQRNKDAAVVEAAALAERVGADFRQYVIELLAAV